jgi:hypothetical protein
MTIPNHESMFANKLDGISYSVREFQYGLNYMDKINFSIAQDAEYSVKLDEDCFINNHVWDYLIENIFWLDDPKYLVLSPLLSNGIPTCDLFIQEFFDKEDADKLFKIFSNSRMPHIWNVDYSRLNDSIKTPWNPDAFYKAVSEFPHFYKGIHPVRLSYEAQKLLLDLFLQDKYIDKFLQKSDYSLLYNKRPYLCNSFFAIKTETWRKIVEDKSLFRDDFDEVPLNLYRENNDLSWLFINKGFGIHTMYNTVSGAPGHGESETQFYQDITNKIYGRNNSIAGSVTS